MIKYANMDNTAAGAPDLSGNFRLIINSPKALKCENWNVPLGQIWGGSIKNKNKNSTSSGSTSSTSSTRTMTSCSTRNSYNTSSKYSSKKSHCSKKILKINSDSTLPGGFPQPQSTFTRARDTLHPNIVSKREKSKRRSEYRQPADA